MTPADLVAIGVKRNLLKKSLGTKNRGLVVLRAKVEAKLNYIELINGWMVVQEALFKTKIGFRARPSEAEVRSDAAHTEITAHRDRFRNGVDRL